MVDEELHRVIAELRSDALKAGFDDISCLFCDIPSDYIRTVDLILNSSSSSGIEIIEKFNVSLKHRLLLCLKSEEWLNDEVVNFVMQLYQERDDQLSTQKASRKGNCFMNSFFYQMLTDHGRGFNYFNVERWTKGKNIFSCNLLFIPIHRDGNHWSLSVISIPRNEVFYFDSLGKDGTEVMDNLGHWLKEEALHKIQSCHHDVRAKNVPCPLQENGFDCGVFLLSFIDLLSNDLPIDLMTQSMCGILRQRIAFWIIRGRLVMIQFAA